MADVWRLVSMIDRNPVSRTRGSLSRTHWAWKFDDFPYPRMQEGVFALVCLHDLEAEGNPFYHSESVASWVEWAFDYWTRLQHGNGAFDEAYPNEQCLAATAFTVFYVGSAFLRWGERLPPALRGRVLTALRLAGQWLCRNDETHGILSNHLAVAVAALEIVSRVCDFKACSQRARFFLERILAHQSNEGWMREYDGADIGYGTHGFFYLAEYWRLTQCEDTLAALRRFAGFLGHFVHPDGTIGGEYSSRNTEFYYPAGFELLAGHCPHSRAIAVAMRDSLQQRRACGVWAMDPFNFLPMLNNLLFAAEAARSWEQVDPLPWQRLPGSVHFPEAGLWLINRERYYAVVGLSKGGTVSVFDKAGRRIAARHAGHFLVWRDRAYASQDHSPQPALEWNAAGDAVTLQVPWKSLGQTVFTPPLFMAFRLFTLTFGRFPAVSRWVKSLLVSVLIRRKRRPPIIHARTLRVQDDGILVEDHIRLPEGVAQLTAAAQFTSIHMGSAMYYDARSPCGSAATQAIDAGGGSELRLAGSMTLSGSHWQRQDD